MPPLPSQIHPRDAAGDCSPQTSGFIAVSVFLVIFLLVIIGLWRCSAQHRADHTEERTRRIVAEKRCRKFMKKCGEAEQDLSVCVEDTTDLKLNLDTLATQNKLQRARFEEQERKVATLESEIQKLQAELEYEKRKVGVAGEADLDGGAGLAQAVTTAHRESLETVEGEGANPFRGGPPEEERAESPAPDEDKFVVGDDELTDDDDCVSQSSDRPDPDDIDELHMPPPTFPVSPMTATVVNGESEDQDVPEVSLDSRDMDKYTSVVEEL